MQAFIIRAVAALLMGALGCSAFAQDASTTFEARTGYPLPQSGIYYDPAQPGTGMAFDVGLEGTVFAALMVYESDGSPTHYTFSGRLDRNDLPSGAENAIGQLRAPLYRGRDGQCLNCPWRAPQIELAADLPPIDLLFTEGRRAEVRVGDTRWRMDRMALDARPIDFAQGTFAMHLKERAAGAVQGFDADVAFAQIAPTPVSGIGSACGSNAPVVAATHELTCVEGDCAGFVLWARGGRVLAWANPDSTTVQLARVTAGSAAALLPGRQYTLNPDALDFTALQAPLGCAPVSGERLSLRLFSRSTQMLSQLSMALVAPGVYWDPAMPGTGYAFERSRDNTIYGSWLGYETDGRPTFRFFQGAVFPTPPLQFYAELRAPLLRSRDGQCLGCPWRAPQVALDEAFPRVGLSAPPSAYLGRVAAGVWPGAPPRSTVLERFALDRDGLDFIRDRWLLSVDDQFVAVWNEPLVEGRQRFDAVVEIDQGQVLDLPAIGGGRSNLLAYRLRCVERCAEFNRWLATAPGVGSVAPQEPFIVQSQLALFTVVNGRYVLTTGSRVYSLNLEERDVLRESSRSALLYTTEGVLVGSMASEGGSLRLFRMPR